MSSINEFYCKLSTYTLNSRSREMESILKIMIFYEKKCISSSTRMSDRLNMDIQLLIFTLHCHVKAVDSIL